MRSVLLNLANCKARRDARRAAGQCIQCGQAISKYVRCLRCRRYMARKARQYRRVA